MSDICEFDRFDEAKEILTFLMRRWNVIAETLNKNEACSSVRSPRFTRYSPG